MSTLMNKNPVSDVKLSQDLLFSQVTYSRIEALSLEQHALT